MIRRASLILSIAALVGVQGLLCIAACLDQKIPASSTAAEEHGEGAPCHGSGPTAPERPDSNEHECNCDRLQLVLSNGDAYHAVGSLETFAAPRTIASIQVTDHPPPTIRVQDRHRSLPPPDILLLKSSLLI